MPAKYHHRNVSDLATEEEREVSYQFLDVENHDFISNG
uniref:Uncharacterized protein n=1 Tax=Arundo donax TaxID=35708 RepID=A0A0A9BRU6_ARUDO